ncbi:VOC family protein [Thalassomonas sp. RHCl1]|uniref:VOC family protein n=1 Tax=Thalassomonas sp. RHCl1 TaxID=2995320 RepID=UPI00248D2EFE|nr:VOC family protein [Thalassomonas sp. RHCl1]
MALKIDHLSLLVTSLEKSMPYYQSLLVLLGFEQVRDHIWTDGEGFFIQFHQARQGTRAYQRYGAGMNHIGFSAPSTDFVYQVQKQMHAAGFEVPEVQDFNGAKALFMKDDDGIRFEITYYPPGVAVVD